MTPKICVSILPKTEAAALRLIEQAEEATADFVEVRLDLLKNVQRLADMAACGKTPKIATTKNFSFGETEHQKLLLKAAKNGFAYVDVDLGTPSVTAFVKELKGLGSQCIVSYHNHSESLIIQELNAVLGKQLSAGADICKIVTSPLRQSENLSLLGFTQTASAKAKTVCFGMGQVGKVSRLLSPVFGGFFTFASLERGSETAPGQITIDEMRSAYKLLGL